MLTSQMTHKRIVLLRILYFIIGFLISGLIFLHQDKIENNSYRYQEQKMFVENKINNKDDYFYVPELRIRFKKPGDINLGYHFENGKVTLVSYDIFQKTYDMYITENNYMSNSKLLFLYNCFDNFGPLLYVNSYPTIKGDFEESMYVPLKNGTYLRGATPQSVCYDTDRKVDTDFQKYLDLYHKQTKEIYDVIEKTVESY